MVNKAKKQGTNYETNIVNRLNENENLRSQRFAEGGSKDLGDVVSFRGVYGKSSIVPFESGWRAEKKYAGGGILLDQGIHMLDLILQVYHCNN